jgi:hypothetical protein
VIVYRKDLELASSGKEWFREVWGYDGAVVRVEVQLGKESLQDWLGDQRGLEDLREGLADAVRGALERTRYVVREHTRGENDATAAWWLRGMAAVGPGAGLVRGRIMSGRRDKLVKHLDRQIAGLARAKATLQRRPLSDVCRELGTQTLAANVRDPQLSERLRKLEARYRFLEDDQVDGTDGPGASALCALRPGPDRDLGR